MQAVENTLLTKKHVLICQELEEGQQQEWDWDNFDYRGELDYLKKNFCGVVWPDVAKVDSLDPNVLIYFCGNVGKNYYLFQKYGKNIRVVQEFSYGYDDKTHSLISIGQVPINIHNVGVYFRNFFNPPKDYFGMISSSHQFQALTESTKPGTAFRSGIYLTKVEESDEEIKFRLLRCSSNLRGPTDNFRAADTEVVSQVNEIAAQFFEQPTELNHVLAQVYENQIITTESTKQVERKAKIKEHSDKTKDMPRNGLMAFCTFYNQTELENIQGLKRRTGYDFCYHSTSVLTKIRFRLKKDAVEAHPELEQKFDVTLYPNSVLIVSLSTNRLYTHEIVPSGLPIDKLPTRMGYVIRCSKTEAVFKDGQTYIVNGSDRIKLEESTFDGVKELRDIYFQENATSDMINYRLFNFSLNQGDYERPIA
jgi:hypothetical protein